MSLPERKTDGGQFPGEGDSCEPLAANTLKGQGMGVPVQQRAEEDINSVHYLVHVQDSKNEKEMSSFFLRAFPRRNIYCFYTHSLLPEVHHVATNSYKGNGGVQSSLRMAIYPAINGWFNYLKYWETIGL